MHASILWVYLVTIEFGKSARNPLELELQTVVSHHVGVRS